MRVGFTLVELLIVIGIIIFLAAILLPIGFNFYQLQILNGTTDQIVWLLRQARTNALSQRNNSDCGLYFEKQQIILYQGENYQTRQIDLDEIYPLAGSVQEEGLEEINFAKGTGLPKQTGQIILKLNQGEKIIRINQMGLISY
jgi:Tfp pilus assembly protein FimT